MSSLLFPKAAITFIMISVLAQLSSISVLAQQKIEQMRNSVDCGCTSNAEKLNWGPRFYTPMKDHVSYELFHQASGWSFKNGPDDFKIIYIDNFIINNSFDQMNWHFNVVADKIPVEIIHPKNSFKINLTPCTSPSKTFNVPVYFSYTTNRADNYTKPFNGSAKAYLDLILEQMEVDKSTFLKNHLLRLATENIIEYNKLQNKLAQKYKLNGNLNSIDQINYKVKVDAFIKELNQKKIQPEVFMLNELILDEVDEAKLSKKEKNSLIALFKSNLIPLDINEQSEEIYLYNYSISFDTEFIKIEFNSNILARDNANNPLPLFCNVADFNISTERGLEMDIQQVCIENAMFAGSAMKISTDYAKMITPNLKQSTFRYNNYPLLKKVVDRNNHLVDDLKDSYDFQLQNFTGLLLPLIQIEIPFKGITFKAKGNNIILNNQLVSGEIEIPVHELSDDHQNFKIFSNNKVITTTMQELKLYFKSLGFDIQTNPEKSSIKVNFKKIFSI